MDDILFPIEINGGFHDNPEHFSEDEFEAVREFQFRYLMGFPLLLRSQKNAYIDVVIFSWEFYIILANILLYRFLRLRSKVSRFL